MSVGFTRRFPRSAFGAVPALLGAACAAGNGASATAAGAAGLAGAAAFFLAESMIRAAGPHLLKRGLGGRDLSKPSEEKIPEALGE